MKPICMLSFYFLVSALQLQANEDAEYWLKKMQANMEKAYYAQMDGNIQIIQANIPLELILTGNMTYRDATHARFKINMAMTNPDMPMTMDMIVIQDGEFVWTETRMSGMPDPMVAKAKIAKKGASVDVMAFTNPLKQMEQFGGLAELEVVERSDGKVVLAGLLEEGALKDLNLNQANGAEAGEVMYRIEMDEKTAFPSQMSVIHGDQKIFELQLKNVRFMEPKEIPDDLFSYQPPEGVVVQER